MKKTPVRRMMGPTGKKFMLIPPAVWLGGASFSHSTYWRARWSRFDLWEGRKTSGFCWASEYISRKAAGS